MMKFQIIFSCIFSLLVCLEQPAFSHRVGQGDGVDVQWFEWGQKAFEQAKSEDKLILLDLTAVWCHACHLMDQTTYADQQVLTLLQENFIAIRVDTDQRPDLEARYRTGGWPTTSLLLPTGEILFQANSLEPEVMVELLQEAKVLYDSEKEDLRQQAKQLWDRVIADGQKSKSPRAVLRSSMASHSVDMMKREYDSVNGGFRDHPKFFEPEAIQMALGYGFFEDDEELINMGLMTLDRQVALLDPVWGGFYRYAEMADWSQPHFEKMLTIQAKNLHNYVSAYQFTGNTEYKYIAKRVIDFVEKFLTDPLTGQFFESQDADVRDQDGKTLVSGAKFFSLNMIDRKARGRPMVDGRIYTGSNADMTWAYLHAAQALDMPMLKKKALRVLTRIVSERLDLEKGVSHGEVDSPEKLHGILSDHIRLGLALLEAFRVTEEIQFLQNGEALAQSTQLLLEDEKDGGFFDRPDSRENLGLLKIPTKPARENIQAARLYLELFHLTNKDEYRLTAERTLQSVVTTPQPLPIALIGMAVDEWFRPPVHIAVIGLPEDEKAKALFTEAERLYCPRKLIKKFNPKNGKMNWGGITFPSDGKPAAFLCTDHMCLAPVYQPEKMKNRLDELLEILRDSV